MVSCFLATADDLTSGFGQDGLVPCVCNECNGTLVNSRTKRLHEARELRLQSSRPRSLQGAPSVSFAGPRSLPPDRRGTQQRVSFLSEGSPPNMPIRTAIPSLSSRQLSDRNPTMGRIFESNGPSPGAPFSATDPHVDAAAQDNIVNDPGEPPLTDDSWLTLGPDDSSIPSHHIDHPTQSPNPVVLTNQPTLSETVPSFCRASELTGTTSSTAHFADGVVEVCGGETSGSGHHAFPHPSVSAPQTPIPTFRVEMASFRSSPLVITAEEERGSEYIRQVQHCGETFVPIADDNWEDPIAENEDDDPSVQEVDHAKENDDNADPFHYIPPPAHQIWTPAEIHPNRAVAIIYLLVLWLHTQYHLAFRACSAVLVVLAIAFRAAGSPIEPSMLTTLPPVIKCLDAEKSICENMPGLSCLSQSLPLHNTA